MSQEKNLELVVLRIEGRFESDRKIIALTRELGKQSFIAKGARKSGSRLSALSQPFIRAKVSVAFGKQTKFITQSELLSTHSKIRSDYNRLMSALAINELCLTICQFDQPAEKEFELLTQILKTLEEHPEPKIVFLWGLLKFLYLEGILPQWIPETTQENNLFTKIVYFSLRAGQIISPEEERKYPDSEPVCITILLTLDKLGKLDSPPQYIKNLNAVLDFMKKKTSKIFEKNITVFDFL